MPPAFFAGGEVLFEGCNLLEVSDKELRRIRGNRISMVFQEPMTALNPVFTIGNQISEVFRTHQNLTPRKAMDASVEILDKVGVPAPGDMVRDYPFQLSGGMRQRVMISMALACRPKLLLADEPTTALDVTLQAQILDLMKGLQDELGTAIVMITHDLGVIAEMTSRVIVMYAGKIMEVSQTLELFDHPLHPYTQGLMRAIPSAREPSDSDELYEIKGTVPSLLDLPSGCKFHPRCTRSAEMCSAEEPQLGEVRPGHWVACWEVNHLETA